MWFWMHLPCQLLSCSTHFTTLTTKLIISASSSWMQYMPSAICRTCSLFLCFKRKGDMGYSELKSARIILLAPNLAIIILMIILFAALISRHFVQSAIFSLPALCACIISCRSFFLSKFLLCLPNILWTCVLFQIS